MPNPGKFFWYEFMADDVAAAEKFYTHVVGWGTQDSGVPDAHYTLFTAGDAGVAGLMILPEEARKKGARAGWLGYIHVEDADEAAAKIKEAGGIIHREPYTIPTVGRFAVAADPQGAVFLIMKPEPRETRPPAALGTPGHIGWHELHAADGNTALAFYEKLYGFKETGTHDMGPMGQYRLFAAGETDFGGVMTKMPQEPVPYWLYYFNVDNIDAAADRIKSAGGNILHGPAEVPGGSYIINAMDPQNAIFAVVGPKK
ncbi:MAG TPA: VOC family protein [Acetobacteraceae bacterium]|nr:VOC family protein [Acetobacteraceae bacterium]